MEQVIKKKFTIGKGHSWLFSLPINHRKMNNWQQINKCRTFNQFKERNKFIGIKELFQNLFIIEILDLSEGIVLINRREWNLSYCLGQNISLDKVDNHFSSLTLMYEKENVSPFKCLQSIAAYNLLSYCFLNLVKKHTNLNWNIGKFFSTRMASTNRTFHLKWNRVTNVIMN